MKRFKATYGKFNDDSTINHTGPLIESSITSLETLYSYEHFLETEIAVILKVSTTKTDDQDASQEINISVTLKLNRYPFFQLSSTNFMVTTMSSNSQTSEKVAIFLRFETPEEAGFFLNLFKFGSTPEIIDISDDENSSKDSGLNFSSTNDGAKRSKKTPIYTDSSTQTRLELDGAANENSNRGQSSIIKIPFVLLKKPNFEIVKNEINSEQLKQPSCSFSSSPSCRIFNAKQEPGTSSRIFEKKSTIEINASNSLTQFFESFQERELDEQGKLTISKNAIKIELSRELQAKNSDRLMIDILKELWLRSMKSKIDKKFADFELKKVPLKYLESIFNEHLMSTTCPVDLSPLHQNNEIIIRECYFGSLDDFSAVNKMIGYLKDKEDCFWGKTPYNNDSYRWTCFLCSGKERAKPLELNAEGKKRHFLEHHSIDHYRSCSACHKRFRGRNKDANFQMHKCEGMDNK